MHEIHAPALGWANGHWSWAPMQGHMFATPHPHPELQAIQTIESPYPLAIDLPAFPAQQDPNTLIAKPGSRMREIANAEPKGRLILGPTFPIPGRSTKLSQTTGPHTTHLKCPMKPVGQFPAAGGPQTFFRSASVNMCLSSERSATSRFSRLFSSSSWRSRRIR
jgi:hypothetical protein